MQQETVTLVVAGLGIGGTLGGIIVGHFLTRSWQREQWRLDRRKEEFRELISAMSASTVELTTFVVSQKHREPETMTKFYDNEKIVLRMITDRIFISHDMLRLNVGKRYTDSSLKMLREIASAEKDMSSLIVDLIEAARKG